jgi:hypothetical protein
MMTESRRLFRLAPNNGAALIIVLAFVVLLTGLVVAYFSRTATDRQLAQSSFNDTDADLLARSALDIVVGDFKQEIVTGSSPTPAGNIAYYSPVPAANVLPMRSGNPGFAPPEYPNDPIPNLIRRSVRADPIVAPGIACRASAINSTTDVSSNGRSISLARWNSHYLIPRANPSDATGDSTPTNTFVAPDWVLVTRNGPAVQAGIGAGSTAISNPVSTNTSYVVGRYAYAVYDEGGLLDINVAGFPTPGSNPPGWVWDVGRKSVLAFADLTTLPTTPGNTMSTTAVNRFVGFRNYATVAPWTTTPSSLSFSFSSSNADKFSAYFLGPVGVSPWVSPSDHVGTSKDFGTVNPINTGSGPSTRTDQNFITRRELIALRSAGTAVANPNTLQYLGTFSREKNASTWRKNGVTTGQIEANLAAPPTGPGRFYIGNLNAVVPGADVQSGIGLKWKNKQGTTPGWWFYTGPSNPKALAHIPPFAGGNKHFFQILEYATLGISDGTDTTAQILATIALGASLIDQYDPLVGTTREYTNTGTSAGSYTTAISFGNGQFGDQYCYGLEKNDPNLSALAPSPTPTPVPTPMATSIFLGANTSDPNDTVGAGRPFRGVGDFGYGIRTTVAGLPTLDFYTWPQAQNAPWGDSPVLDFFSYSDPSLAPVRSGIVSLNTRQPPVLAALLSGTLLTETASTTVTSAEATAAANTIVNATAAAPALGRADIVRLASAVNTAPFGGASEEVREAIPRALAEVVQTRTWGLLIDIVAQTGRYRPNATSLQNDFIVEGEKRYWLHVAIDRFDGSIVGQQLEEVLE